MGAKLEEKVLRSIAQYQANAAGVFFSASPITPPANLRNIYLPELEGHHAITPAGSLRRGRETIGDLDLLVTGPNSAAALDRMAAQSASS